VSSIDVRPRRKAPRMSFTALQHFRTREPIFSPSRHREGVLPALPCVGRCSVLRVWLPSRRFRHPETLEVYFNLQRSWASPSRAFLLPRDRTILLGPPFPFLRLRPKPPGLDPALQRVTPTGKAALLLAPNGLGWGGGTALLGFSDLSGSLSRKTHLKSISLSRCPSRSYETEASRLPPR